eukprot:TRINITY_DN2088_c0_g1_i1.p1 TRINITY_DN2088_c0_g1~~TRINITY_DN2088_c0_g1_i1.p1  ORF type:complete len:264 (-),score=67.93 TRINITY_DN2088_c0_g1_i1:53-844(-)
MYGYPYNYGGFQPAYQTYAAPRLTTSASYAPAYSTTTIAGTTSFAQPAFSAQPSFVQTSTVQPVSRSVPLAASSSIVIPKPAAAPAATVIKAAPKSEEVKRAVSERAAAWTARSQWDFDELPHPEGFRFYYKCIIFTAAADGSLDPKEKEWILGYAEAMGAPADLIAELESINPAQLKVQNFGTEFEKFLQRSDRRSQAAKKGIIFDCIRAASADGNFAAQERSAVIELAGRFKLTEKDVKELEAIVAEEKALKIKKAKLVNN